ncbi:hypothetical protein T484DRAFT_1622781, partial [Baffinella frigidus]
FLCHVCLGSPNKPVATVCGHIYCWGCLYKWLSLHRDDPNCPVCKAGIEVPEGDLSKARAPAPETRNPKPETRKLNPETRNPKPETRNPKPETRNPKPETRNPKPETRNLKTLKPKP